MSKGDKKKDKRQYEKVEEWIQMEDLNSPKNENLNRKFAIEEGKQFQPSNLKQPTSSQSPNNPQSSRPKEPQVLTQTQAQNQKIAPVKNVYEVIQTKARREKKKPSLPMIEVTCDFCTVPQSVPGNVQLYICGSCQNINECYPLYGIVICGCCQSKVGFGFGMTEYIKCPKCGSLSKVPLQPAKNYEAVVPIANKQNGRGEREREREWEKEKEKEKEKEFAYAGFERERNQQDLI